MARVVFETAEFTLIVHDAPDMLDDETIINGAVRKVYAMKNNLTLLLLEFLNSKKRVERG